LLLTRSSGNAFKEMVKFIDALYKAYCSDASMFEINPVLKTSDNKISCDAKVNIDDNAIQTKKLAEMRDIPEKTNEVKK
jgi:succinyl-CoA synthetase beta subunit